MFLKIHNKNIFGTGHPLVVYNLMSYRFKGNLIQKNNFILSQGLILLLRMFTVVLNLNL